jgi:iron complex transport system substrate-binding protein
MNFPKKILSFQIGKAAISGILSINVIVIAIISCGCISADVPTQSLNSDKNETPNLVTITDLLNRSVTIPVPSERLIPNHNDVVELLLALDAEDTIIGAPEESLTDPDFQGRLENVTNIGDRRVPNVETLLTLKPDVLIVMSHKTRNDDILQSHNLTILYLDCYKLDTLPREAMILGTLTNRETKAKEYVDFIEKYQNLVSSRIPKGGLNTTIYAEKYSDFEPESGGTQTDQMIQILHGKNIAHDLPQVIKVSPEWVIDQNPGIILRFESNTFLRNGGALKDRYGEIINRSGFERIDAVRNHQVYVLQSDMFYSPRAVVGLVYLAKILYPKEFSDINPDTILKEYEEKFLPVSYRDDISYPPIRADAGMVKV